jgi:hypothetical protein
MTTPAPDIGRAWRVLCERLILVAADVLPGIVFFVLSIGLHALKPHVTTDSKIFNICVDGFIYVSFVLGALKIVVNGVVDLLPPTWRRKIRW